MTASSTFVERVRGSDERARPERVHRQVEVLLVEDSPDWAAIVREMLRESSPGMFSITSCERLASACAHLSQSRTDCVLLDLSLPDARGLDALRRLKNVAPSPPIVVLSGIDDEDVACVAVQEGAQDYLVKGHVDGHLLNRAVRYAIERKRVEAELAVAHELGLAIGEATTVEGGLRVALQKICERTGWVLGQAWVRRPGHPHLECSAAWHATCEGLETFRRTSETMTFERGVGLPGSAWLKKASVWFSDVKTDLNFPRAPAAKQSGLGAGMAVPVMARDEVVAVLEFFVFEQREEDDRLVEVVSAVAAQLGSLVLRKQAEEALRHGEERLRLVLETAHEAFVSIDAEGVITAWNGEAEAIFGWPREDALGRRLVETVMPPQYRDAHEKGLEHFLRTGEGPVLHRRLELTALHHEGHEFPVEFTISPLKTGDTYVFNAFLRDITERKQAEQELREGEAKLAEAQQLAHIGSWQWEIVADELTWSAELYRIFGLDPKSFGASYDAFLESVAPEDREFVNRTLAKALIEHDPFEFHHRVVRADGTTRIVHCRGEVVTGENGDPVELRGTAQDVTESREAEEALAESEARYRLMANNSTDVIATSDRTGVLTYVSPSVRRLFGYEPEEVLGRDIFEFVHPDDLTAVSSAHKRVLESPESLTISYRCRQKDGNFIWVEVIARQVCDPQTGEVREVQSTCRDISERKRAEEELVALAESLEESNRELEQFATVASHDLQEPLRKIQAFGSLLTARYADALDEPGRDYLERMENAALRMQALIDNLLTLSRVTTRAQPFTLVDLDQTARDAVADLELTISEAGARVEVGPLPTLEADPLQMRQLLQNLISNSVKFARSDCPPVIKVYAQDRSSGGATAGSCTICVEDNGIGFDVAQLDRIFQVFERLHSRSEYDGTGMGLAICKKIAKRHGGDITATSLPDEGSTFIVTLPVGRTDARDCG